MISDSLGRSLGVRVLRNSSFASPLKSSISLEYGPLDAALVFAIRCWSGSNLPQPTPDESRVKWAAIQKRISTGLSFRAFRMNLAQIA